MQLPKFDYIEPRSVEEACLFLKDHSGESRILGGGTDLLPSMKQMIFRPRYVVSLCKIPGLDRIESNGGSGVRIGCLATLRSLERSTAILNDYLILHQAASSVGSVQLREMGTLGGNLCLDTRCYYYNQSAFWRRCRSTCLKMGGDTCNVIGGGKRCFAVFSGDLAAALIALDAKIEICSAKGERVIPLADFYTGYGERPLALSADEIVVGVRIPAAAKGSFGRYLKYRIRKAIDFPLAGVALVMRLEGKEKICREARMVLGAVGPKPAKVEKVDEVLVGKKIDSRAIEEIADLAFKSCRPVDNVAGTASHRRRMIKSFAQRSIEQAIKA